MNSKSMLVLTRGARGEVLARMEPRIAVDDPTSWHDGLPSPSCPVAPRLSQTRLAAARIDPDDVRECVADIIEGLEKVEWSTDVLFDADTLEDALYAYVSQIRNLD